MTGYSLKVTEWKRERFDREGFSRNLATTHSSFKDLDHEQGVE